MINCEKVDIRFPPEESSPWTYDCLDTSYSTQIEGQISGVGAASCRVSCCCAQQPAQLPVDQVSSGSPCDDGVQAVKSVAPEEIIILTDDGVLLAPSLVTSQQLHDIEEEEDLPNGEGEVIDAISLSSSSLTIRKDQQKLCNSPSPTFSSVFIKSSSSSDRKKKKKKVRTKSVTSTTSSDTCGSASGSHKMQAEQGSIGDLQKYHNRYLRNRRHTLANVR